MTEALCSCCKLLGKPPAGINFIIIAGSANSMIYQRVKYLLRNYSATSLTVDDIRLTNYEPLMVVSEHLFKQQVHPTSPDQSTSTVTQACCNGLSFISSDIDDPSDPDQLRTFERLLRDLLDLKNDLPTEESSTESKPASWVIFTGPIYLEAALINVFLQLNNPSSSLLNFKLTVVCFLVDEQRLFENWLTNDQSIYEYQSSVYPEYQSRVERFFSCLSHSQNLQQNTSLIDERTVPNDNDLQTLLKGLFRNRSLKYRATNNQLCYNMANLLSFRRRTVHDVRNVRNNLQRYYSQSTADRLKPLLYDLQQTSTAINAARQITQLFYSDFIRMDKEERKVYKRQMTIGFNSHDSKDSNTIAAELVRYALRSLEQNDSTLAPLLYSTVLVICSLGTHFFFRHELFNHTPEIYTLSLLLVNQRQYALTLAGLRLCGTILNGDQREHKYALAYLTRDPLTPRKILDAVQWLLSPYLTLKSLWRVEDDDDDNNDKTDIESKDAKSALYTMEEFCFRHACTLVERSYIRNLASLFHGSANHCAQLVEDDIHNLADVIRVLGDRRLASSFQGKNLSSSSLKLISHLCALLTPIFLYSSPAVNTVLQNKAHLLINIPEAIRGLLRTDDIDKDLVDLCVNFYAHFIEARCKQVEEADDNSSDDSVEDLTVAPTIPLMTSPLLPFNSSKDLIPSYFALYRQVQEASYTEERSTQHEQIQGLLNDEWKKLDTLQLQHDHQKLKNEHLSLKDELAQLKDVLQRTQSERDEFRKENSRMAKEIDTLKAIPTARKTIESQQLLTPASTNSYGEKNTIDELEDLRPHEVTKEQAEQCIREIYQRRTTFSDHDMRKSICGSLKHLGSDLYSSPVHFLHELIQNAEDNFYDPSIVPCLRIELNHSYILFSNNEQGLRARDVLAICSLAVSTKTHEQQHIGEKGVGFKSVFVASNQPMLISHAWKFAFHVPGLDTMSYITPLWISDESIPHHISEQISVYSEHTHLYLPLKLQTNTPEADRFLNQVAAATDPCILLNMRQLKKLEINDKRSNKMINIEKQFLRSTKLEDQSSVTFEDFTYLDLTGSVIQLCTSSGYNTFRVYTCYIDVPNSIEQRRSPRTRLILAFPCENDYRLTSTVYAGLPVCDLGFNFLFNADFQLVTSRENVRENSPFNVFLRDHLSALFVYLLLNDSDLREDRYCPSSNNYQVKHSSWWLVMIDSIDVLIKKYLSVFLDIQKGKTTRRVNSDVLTLVSEEQLYNCADIKVIDADNNFLTNERLKSLQIQSVSILDVLQCFPNREEATNEFRQQFRLWTQSRYELWWSQLFQHITQTMTPELADIMLKKPIFLLRNNNLRDYLPTDIRIPPILFVSNDPLFRMWKQQLTLLHYSTNSEKTALLRSNHVQLLTDLRLIEIIRQDHLQLASSSLTKNEDDKRIEEVWNDLHYLNSQLDKLDRSIPFLVPVEGIPNLAIIQNAILPTILTIDIRSHMHWTTSPIILLPYRHRDHQLINRLQWEHFLLEMNCRPPSVYLPDDYPIAKLPLLPSFTTFTDEKCARLGESIVSSQTESTRNSLGRFPIIDSSQIDQHIAPVSTVFEESIVRDLSLLPRVTIPSHCRALAAQLGVRVQYDLRTCVTILQMLSDSQNTNVDLYVQWLGYLQLYVRQQRTDVDSKSLLSSCQLYLPDQRKFSSLEKLLIVSNKEEHQSGNLLVSKYLKLELITPSSNQIYWQFKELFILLNCKCTVTIDHIYDTIYLASVDKSNFFSLGDCATTLTENGMETMIILFTYLEDSILYCVKENAIVTDLYHAVVEAKPERAPCGSREDLEWRFSLTRNSLSQQLAKLTGIQSREKKIGLPTINRQIIKEKAYHFVYACLETKIIQNLLINTSKRCFISPVIARTCPLVLAAFNIDYVERRGVVRWIHKNNNLEYDLTQLTDIFRAALDDPELQVVTAKFATVSLLLSDGLVLKAINELEEDNRQIDEYDVDSEYPFWIFNKTILLCTGYVRDDSSKAIIALSSLITLLHKRKHIPFEEAKAIAHQKISACSAFRSEKISSVASTSSTTYTYIDLLFPTDHHSIESMIISIEQCGTTEHDLDDTTANTTGAIIAADRSVDDQIYRSRLENQDHTSRNENNAHRWSDSSVVDGIEQIRIGQKAEHFFFVYLQSRYGSIDVTPTKNWRSSSRRAVYPECRRNVDDSSGFDFELHDTREVFVRGSRSTTKYCYFEVKGTSGFFNRERTRFHISQNESNVCETIASDRNRREREAYFIVIIQNCLDPEKISFGTVIDWTNNFDTIYRTVDSYQCKIVSSPSRNFKRVHSEDNTENYQHQQRFQGQPRGSDNRNNQFVVQPQYGYPTHSTSNYYNGPSYQSQQHQRGRQSRGRHTNNTHFQ